MLRSDQQAALNELLIACQAQAHRLHHAAAQLRGERAREWEALAEERERLAQRVEEQVRRSGDLPDAADPEREALDDVVSRVRTLFARDDTAELAHELFRAEQELGRLAVLAEKQPLEEEAQALMGEVVAATERARERLRRLGGEG